ncbi:MAG: hypothetical protein Q4D23_12310, partial [Bacteroidales bacterium]|nr:hypothetical protein [Bacteroidales bacterium]
SIFELIIIAVLHFFSKFAPSMAAVSATILPAGREINIRIINNVLCYRINQEPRKFFIGSIIT